MFSDKTLTCRGTPSDVYVKVNDTINITSPDYPYPYIENMISLCTWTFYLYNSENMFHIRFFDFVGPDWLKLGVSVPPTFDAFVYVPWTLKPAGMIVGFSPQVLFGFYESGDDGKVTLSGYQRFETQFWIQVALLPSGKKNKWIC